MNIIQKLKCVICLIFLIFLIFSTFVPLASTGAPYVQNWWDTNSQSQLPYPSNLVNSVSNLSTNNSTGYASGVFQIMQYNPLLWLNPRAVVTTNNLFGVTSVADSSGNGNAFYNDPTAAAPIYSQTGFGGYPCWQMHANWNLSSGANPTVFYALTNAMVWGQVFNTSNFLIVDTFQDTLEANNQFTNNGVKLASPPILFSVGNNVQLFENPAGGSSSGFSASMNVNVCGGTIYPLLRHSYTPNVTCLQVINGVASFWVNGVKVVTPISTASGPQTSTGTGFTIGNANYAGSLYLSGHAAFCGNQSDFLIYSNVVPDSGVKSISDYLMKANGIRGGTAINLWGDSIMIGSFSTSGISNFLGLIQYYNPNTLVSDFAISGAVSGQILGYMTNNGAAQPPTTGNVIDIWYAGVNDAINGVSVATWESNTTNAMNYSHSLGHKFDICELASYAGETGNTITRTAQTTFIDGLAGKVDAIIPLAHDPIVGTNGASVQSGTPYYANSIHFNAAGYQYTYQTDFAPILQSQLYGSQPIGGITITNFISGLFYTNNTAYCQEASVQVTNITAGVVGNSIMAVQIPGQVTNFVGMSSILTSLATTNLDTLSGFIPPSGFFCFTNLSTGAGDGAFLGNGQLLTLP